jgi:hypothetical protein
MLSAFGRRDALRWAGALALSPRYQTWLTAAETHPDVLQASILGKYDRVTAALSEPGNTRWKHFGSVYFRTNEKLLNRFYPRFENAGGVVVGVSFQQNLSLLVHARPELSVIFDINPAVTEILVPFVGGFLTASPTRQAFISKLLSLNASAEDTKLLLQGGSDSETHPGAVYADLVRKTAPDSRARLQREWKEAMEGILARLSLDSYQRSEVLRWQKILDDEEYLPGDFFLDSVIPYTLSANPKIRKSMDGWLSSEENYRLVRRYWMEGRIIGVTGDIGGPSLTNLASWLRKADKTVSTIYLSDVGTAMTGPGTPAYFLQLYETLGQLPLQRKAQVLISHGSMLTAYARKYDEALWLYRYLSDVDYSTFYRLNANVLQRITQEGASALIPAFRREFERLVEDKRRKDEPIGEGAVQLFSRLLDRVEGSVNIVKTLDLPGFTRWVRKEIPGFDTDSSLFRTTAATLKESGALKSS